MKHAIAAALAGMALTCPAYAQEPAKGYIEGVAQSTFGNVTSQSYGAEGGFSIASRLQIFGEVAHANDTATASLATSAQVIAGALSQTQSNVGYNAEQPTTFGLGGIRFLFPASAKIEPYVRVGAGVASVQKNVTYTVNGTDVTGNLPQYGIVLGTDLSGTETKMMLDFGGGVSWAIWQKLVVDLQYRYGHVFADDEGINISRAGIGVGIRF
jgi:opacity protein-like surface antigen